MCVPAALIQTLFQPGLKELSLIALVLAMATLFHESGFHMQNQTNNSEEVNNSSKTSPESTLSDCIWAEERRCEFSFKIYPI